MSPLDVRRAFLNTPRPIESGGVGLLPGGNLRDDRGVKRCVVQVGWFDTGADWREAGRSQGWVVCFFCFAGAFPLR